ncbi:MAG TPA: DUF177 domain-containing protein [Ignavibacteriaceae bacterium]|nr:DUF177 domain-containing protein [Ignavibacteriaceae bacterium]
MIIKISNLVEGEHAISFDESIKKIELEEPFFGNFHSDIVLNKLHDQIIVEAHTTVNAKFDCDRCGTEFTAILTNDYRMVYLMNESPVDSEAINIAYLPRDAATIDLKSDLREFAILSIPMKKLCNPECKGFCYKCGGDLNNGECTCTEPEIDPRWQKLIDLKNNIKQ